MAWLTTTRLVILALFNFCNETIQCWQSAKSGPTKTCQDRTLKTEREREREREREGGKERIITRVASDEYFTIFTFCLQSGTERGDHKWVSTDWVDVMGLLLCIQNCLTSPREPRQSKTRNCLKLGSTWTMYNRNWVLKKCQGIVLAFMTL